MKKPMAFSAIFLFIGFSFTSVFAQKEESNTVVSGKLGVSSVQHEFDIGESKFHHPVSFFSVKVERKLGEKVHGCVEVLGYLALNQKSPNKGEKIEVGGCIAYKPVKRVNLEVSFTNYQARKYSVKKLSLLASREWEINRGSVELYNETMLLSGSDEHQKNGVLNKTGVSTTFYASAKTKIKADVAIGVDNAPLEFESGASTLFSKVKAERKISTSWSVFGEWKYTKPFTDRESVMSFQTGLSFRFSR